MLSPAGMQDEACSSRWQVRFDDGHQQRYLADRTAVLRYVLAVAPHAASKRFEVFAETEPIFLADGSPGGRQFALTEVIDMSQPTQVQRLEQELAELARPTSQASDHDPAGTSR